MLEINPNEQAVQILNQGVIDGLEIIDIAAPQQLWRQHQKSVAAHRGLGFDLGLESSTLVGGAEVGGGTVGGIQTKGVIKGAETWMIRRVTRDPKALRELEESREQMRLHLEKLAQGEE